MLFRSSPYVDLDKRYADGIIILYGNNKTKQIELAQQYSLKYIYFDQFISYPMIVSLKYKKYLEDNGVNFSIQNVRLDPSTEEAPSYVSLVVPFQNPTILNITKSVKEFNIGNQKYGIIYRIDYLDYN